MEPARGPKHPSQLWLLFVETPWVLVQLLYYVIQAFVLFFVPAAFKRKDISGQRVLITGAGSGIGRLLAIEFAKKDCHVILWDVNKEGNENTAMQIRKMGQAAHSYTVDVTSPEQIYKSADLVKKDIGTIDILVNNAGIVTGKPFLDSPDTSIQRTMDVNVNAHFWMIKAFLPGMLTKGRGHIVNIASSAGIFGVAGLVDYCASKFAAVGLDEALRAELYALGKSNQVNLTVVCPFFINTGMFDGVSSKMSFLLPILEPDYAVKKIMNAVLTNQTILCLPRVVYVFAFLKTLIPTRALLMVADHSGALNYMDYFVGRRKD